MADNIGGDRPLRVCDLCGGVDDHPRHVITGGILNAAGVAEPFPRPGDNILSRVIANAPGEERAWLIGQLLDTSASDRHMDCCRTAGCPDGTCVPQTAGAEDLRGGDLLAHLEAKGADQ
jgi:hypothetical protein